MIISEKIKAICEAKGTSMFALEKQLGMGNGTIGKWGKNGRVPNYAKLSAVCSALGISVEDVMSDEPIPGIKKAPDPKIGSDLERRFRAAAEKLPPELLERELAYLEQLVQKLHSPTDSDM